MDQDYICGDWGDVTDWTQLRVTVALSDLDELTAIMSMVSNNLQIEDYSDIDLKTCYGDLIDESILNADKTIASVSVYLPAERNVAETVAFLRARFDACGLKPKKIETVGVKEEDWANSWKQYYKPIHIGNEIVVVPEWEHYEPSAGEKVITMDPGMAFGTGTHETTRLVMRLLEKLMPRDAEGIRNGVLDVGTGSGILSICAAKLNPAARCEAYDIDPMAVRVANENIRKNGLEGRILCREADLLRGVPEHPRRVICANLVADIIIRMIPSLPPFTDPSTVLLASGIIEERRGDVEDCFRSHGYEVFASEQENGWCALAVREERK